MLAEKDVIQYWEKRAAAQGAATVGFAGHSLTEQDAEYEQKKGFIREHVPDDVPVLDYGCGTGRFSDCFEKEYLGVDITESLLEVARKNNPAKNYRRLENPWLEKVDFNFVLFFTSTVLQHNDDEMVKKILKSVRDCRGSMFFGFVLYENSQVQAPHVKGRSSEEYAELVKTVFNVLHFWSYSHIVHGEEHTLTIINVEQSYEM